MTLPSPVRGLRAAFVLLTRIPVGGFPYRSEDFVWAAAHAPFVGLVLGVLLGGLDCFLSPLGPLSSAALVIGVSLLLTGAFHEDGLADTCDALGSGGDARKVLSVLKDSRIGSFGGAALVVSIAGRAALLAQLGPAGVWAMPIVGCGARVCPIWLMAWLPYVTSAGKAKSSVVTRAGVPHAVVATTWFVGALAVAIATSWISVVRAGVLATALIGVTLILGWRYRVRAGGITGDFLGATEQVSEILALAVIAWKT